MKSPAFAFYVRDWISSIRVKMLSGDATKAYINLLCHAWLEEPRATLPIDDKILAVMADVSDLKWVVLKREVLPFFKVGKCQKHHGRYYSEKLLEISNLSDIRSLAKKNKTKSKSKRFVKSKGASNPANANANVSANISEDETPASQYIKTGEEV